MYLLRKPSRFISDYEFSADITVPIEKQKKKAKKAFNELDDMIDNIQEESDGKDGKDGKTGDERKERLLTANVCVNVLTEGVMHKIWQIRESGEGKKDGTGETQ